ncbi:ATP-dependent helicase [Romboutsia sp. 1001713B170207_170306_H8]|uniref:ATP-dependent helicase n=1 Tax=Romboutsia sp. 1001713B170207_170306_H8 TaxID=2787112 RepID=UPI002FE6F7D7
MSSLNKINYREDQIPIINYKSGTMAVPAVPGAGKTFIVTNLVAKLLEENLNEKGKILILTYMNSAVNNFKGRIKKILEEKDIQKHNLYEVMTIHSLAVKIIKEKPEIIMLSDEFNIADDLQKNIILTECINRYRLSGGEKIFNFFLKEQKSERWRDISLENWDRGFYDLIGNAISELKYKDITPDKLEENISSDYKGMLRIVLPIYKEYDRKLKQQGLLDYDDILVLGYKALSIDDDLRSKFQNKYTYVFEDECQDSNEIQGKIIKLICEKNNNLVRVGDINQSITGTFSSADPKYFKNFIDNADYCYRMDMSNRSSKDILDLANELVSYVTKEFNQVECREALEDMKIKTVPENKGYKENPKPENYTINAIKYETWKEEIIKTVRFTKNIKHKYPDKSIGILVPFNDHVSQVGRELENVGLEFEELGPNSSNKRKTLNNIGYIIDFVLNCDNINKLITVLDKAFIHSDNELGKKDFIEILKKYNTEELIYNEEIQSNLILDTHGEIFKGFKYGVDSLKEILAYPIVRLDLFILFIGEKLNLEQEDRAIVDYISFYVKFLISENINTNLQDVYNIIVDTRNKVFSHIIEVVYEINGYEPSPGSITVCNYHKSKGLEWDCVFLLGLSEFNFPDNVNQKFQCEKWYLKDKYKNPEAIIKNEIDAIIEGYNGIDYEYQTKINIINEKIRLLYVGITRAKEMLIMSTCSFKDEVDVGNERKRQNPCIYLWKLNNYIKLKRGK